MDHVTRFNLKPSCQNRQALIDFCLNNSKQYLVIGWSYIYENEDNITDYKSFYYAVKKHVNRINPAFNVLWDAKEDDLFWTRDLDGCYWICRAIGNAVSMFRKEMDIGAALPIEAYKIGMEVPGQIKAAFNRPRGGITERISERKIIEYSKYVYNQESNTDYYSFDKINSSLLDNLPDFDLEELVISYLQIEENYYVLSNSIANKSTTIKIECELISRDVTNFRKAVVQVKGGSKRTLNALDYISYANDGYIVYFYAPVIDNIDASSNFIEIKKDDLEAFYKQNKMILPDSIRKWETLFD